MAWRHVSASVRKNMWQALIELSCAFENMRIQPKITYSIALTPVCTPVISQKGHSTPHTATSCALFSLFTFTLWFVVGMDSLTHSLTHSLTSSNFTNLQFDFWTHSHDLSLARFTRKWINYIYKRTRKFHAPTSPDQFKLLETLVNSDSSSNGRSVYPKNLKLLHKNDLEINNSENLEPDKSLIVILQKRT